MTSTKTKLAGAGVALLLSLTACDGGHYYPAPVIIHNDRPAVPAPTPGRIAPAVKPPAPKPAPARAATGGRK